MPSTNFINGTVIEADWLNDVNDTVYSGKLTIGTDSSTISRYTAPGTGSVTRTVAEKLYETVSCKDFGAVGDGVADDTAAIIAALASGALDVHLPAGSYKITASITIPNYVTLRGDGYGLFAGTGATRIIKTGNFIGVVLSGASQLVNLTVEGAAGNGSDGIQVLGGRSVIRDVGSFAHGRDGIKIGDYTAGAANTNLWRAFNIISRSNTRYGVFVAHEGSAGVPNNNAGILVGLEATSNGSHGLAISDTVDNEFYGVCNQSNVGQGVYIGNLAKGNYLAPPYTEANTAGDVLLDTGSSRNYVMGFRGGTNNDGIVDNGTSNVVIGRYASVQDVPLHKSPEAFKDLRLLETTTSGVWKLTKQATTRHAVLELSSTSSTGDLLITNTGGGSAGLRFGTGTDDAAQRSLLKTGITLNFGSIPAASTGELTVTLAGVDSSYELTITPTHAVPAGITWSVFWNGTAIKARCANVTSGAITVNGSFTVIARKMV